jgi:hypothetical protein
MGMAVARTGAAGAHVEERHVGGRVDHGRVRDLAQQLVEPEVVVDADAQHRARFAKAREILRARLEALGVLSRGDEVRDRDGIATDGRRERLQLGCRGDDAKLGVRDPRQQRPDEKYYFRQRDLGITQWMFFWSPDMSPTRQSMAALARP